MSQHIRRIVGAAASLAALVAIATVGVAPAQAQQGGYGFTVDERVSGQVVKYCLEADGTPNACPLPLNDTPSSWTGEGELVLVTRGADASCHLIVNGAVVSADTGPLAECRYTVYGRDVS